MAVTGSSTGTGIPTRERSRKIQCPARWSRAAEGADKTLPHDIEGVRRLSLPAHAELLGICARSDRPQRAVARVLADGIASFAVPALGHVGLRSRAGCAHIAPSARAVAIRPVDRAATRGVTLKGRVRSADQRACSRDKRGAASGAPSSRARSYHSAASFGSGCTPTMPWPESSAGS